MSVLALVLALCSGAAAQQFPAGAALAGDEPLFSVESPIGSIDYLAGRGLRLGRSGLTIGGFSTVEVELEQGEHGVIDLDSINFLTPWRFTDSISFFAEIEIGGLLSYDTGTGKVESDVEVALERIYGEYNYDDRLNARLGKFLTPVGIWNTVPAEPFTWTATNPVFLETALSEHTTGAALFGSFYPGENTLDYWLYGQFFDEIYPSEDPEPINSSVGGRLRYGAPLGDWAVGSSFMAAELAGDWSFLGGLDGYWKLGPVELQSEFTIVGGALPDRNQWDVYLQGVYELGSLTHYLRGLYLVGRYEHNDPSGSIETTNIGDVGLTWIPTHFVIIKAGYRFSDRQTEEVRRGFFSSISVLF